jgi:hypothetical protein
MFRQSAAGIFLGVTVMSSAAYAESRQFDLSSFTEIEISSGVRAEVKVGAPQAVSIEADKRDAFDKLSVEVRNGKLQIGIERGFLESFGELLSGNQPRVTASIALPVLTRIEASAGARVSADVMIGDSLKVDASSGASVTVASLRGAKVSVSASSGGNADLAGRCERLDVSASSGGALELEKLQCAAVRINVSSGGHAAVYASASVDAHASSGGSASVAGKPSEVSVESTFGGHVEVPR